jgi:hypothetical protein
MHDYATLKKLHGSSVSQTIDAPIMVADFWELSDAFLALFIVLVFGVLAYAWTATALLLLGCLIIVPLIKRRHHRGVFLHWPYRNLGMTLPGLVNPRGRRKFSD